MSIILRDSIDISVNVQLTLKDLNGNVQDERVLHNVFTDMGSNWIRNLISVSSYAAPIEDHAWSHARPQYVGVGVGGVFQTATPPGGGTYTETTAVVSMEFPVQVTNTPSYLKQLIPQTSLLDTDFFPNARTVRFRTVLLPNEVSFPTQPTYGTSVPLTEAMLFTSDGDPLVEPGPPLPATGAIAYAIFAPLYKTPYNLLEIAWELRA